MPMNWPDHRIDAPPQHDGTAADPHGLFFAPPDPRVGVLRSAVTSVDARAPNRLTPTERRDQLTSAAFWGFLLAVPSSFIHLQVTGETSVHQVALHTAAWALVVTFARKPARVCTYVGEDGAQRSTSKAGRVHTEVVCFRDVAQLLVRRTERRVKGVRAAIVATFWFLDARNHVLLEVVTIEPDSGTGYVSDGADRPHLFAAAVQKALDAWRRRYPKAQSKPHRVEDVIEV